MPRRLNNRLARLEQLTPPCLDCPGLPALADVLDTPEPTKAEQRALAYARYEQLIRALAPGVSRGDRAAITTTARIVEQQSALVGVSRNAREDNRHQDVITAEDLMKLIESAPDPGEPPDPGEVADRILSADADTR